MKRFLRFMALLVLVVDFIAVVMGVIVWAFWPEHWHGKDFANLLIHGTVVALILFWMGLPKMDVNESKK